MKTELELTAWLLHGKSVAGLPVAIRNLAREAMRRHEFEGKIGQEAIAAEAGRAIILLGASDATRGGALSETEIVFAAARRAAAEASRLRADSLVFGGHARNIAEVALRGLEFERYSFKGYCRQKPRKLAVTVVGATEKDRERASICAKAVGFARDLVNLPPEQKSPARFTAMVEKELRGRGLKTTVWNEKKLREEMCGGILAVGRGSANPPRLMRIEYAPRGSRKHLVLVGKGVIFDSGGLSIKTADGMKTMKCDMAGAAAVVSALGAAADLRLPTRITAFVGLVENMLSGMAYKPGDVVTMRSGKTVEVLNTDAEGRIVLGDLLDLARKLSPFAIVDLATLTGACVVALGEERAGLIANDDRLAERLLAAAARSAEPIWRLPLGAEYRKAIAGVIADLKNTGGRWGGASTAAEFLRSFVGDEKWAHLDIAGPCFKETGKPGGATGFGTALLIDFLASF